MATLFIVYIPAGDDAVSSHSSDSKSRSEKDQSPTSEGDEGSEEDSGSSDDQYEVNSDGVVEITEKEKNDSEGDEKEEEDDNAKIHSSQESLKKEVDDKQSDPNRKNNNDVKKGTDEASDENNDDEAESGESDQLLKKNVSFATPENKQGSDDDDFDVNRDHDGELDMKPNIPNEDHLEMINEHISFEQLLQAILESLEITGDVWTKTDDEENIQVSFLVETERADVALQYLSKHGIGVMENTSISLFPSDYHMMGRPKPQKEVEEPDFRQEFEEKMNRFLKSVKSRLTVAQVVEVVKANARFTFDYVLLIIIASFIAAMGLVENSSVILVASMLVSPLMGPIMGGVFGGCIQNKQLWKMGLRNEILGLLMCLICGFLSGVIVSIVNVHGNKWGATDAFPTAEMKSRGELRSLWVGVLIAIPSGAGVALGILGGNTGSLVGVAISASLLPPVVNSGILWAFGIVSSIHPPDFEGYTSSTINYTVEAEGNATTVVPVVKEVYPPNCPPLVDNDYEFVYRCDMAIEAYILGAVSALLTLLNISCIIVMGILILKLKEVAPTTALSTYLDSFWNTDIKIARDSYRTMKTSNDMSINLAKQAKIIAKEAKENKFYDASEYLENQNFDTMNYYTAQNIDANLEQQGIGAVLPRFPVALQLRLEQGNLGSASNLFRGSFEKNMGSTTNLYRGNYTQLNHQFTIHGMPSLSRDTPTLHNNDYALTQHGLKRRRRNSHLDHITSEERIDNDGRLLRIVRDNSQSGRKANRQTYRQISCPADSFNYDPAKSKNKGRFMISTVPIQEEPAESSRKVSLDPSISESVHNATSRVVYKDGAGPKPEQLAKESNGNGKKQADEGESKKKPNGDSKSKSNGGSGDSKSKSESKGDSKSKSSKSRDQSREGSAESGPLIGSGKVASVPANESSVSKNSKPTYKENRKKTDNDQKKKKKSKDESKV